MSVPHNLSRRGKATPRALTPNRLSPSIWALALASIVGISHTGAVRYTRYAMHKEASTH